MSKTGRKWLKTNWSDSDCVRAQDIPFDNVNSIKGMMEKIALFSNRTISVSSGNTVGEIQTQIDAVPKNLNGYTLYVSFPSATMVFSTLYSLRFSNFYGGYIVINGVNNTDSVLSFSNMIDSCLFTFSYVSASITVRDFRAVVTGNVTQNTFAIYNASHVYFYNMKSYTAVTNKHRFIYATMSSSINCQSTDVQGMDFAFNIQQLSHLYANNITGSSNNYCFYVAGGFIVGYDPNISITGTYKSGTSAGGTVSLTT